MREILFRGKGIKDNVWVYGDLLQDKCGHTRIQAQSPLRFSNEVDFSTVGQYTGLTDKNGKKIFEGDIIKTNLVSSIGIIKFGEHVCNPSNYVADESHIGFYVDWFEYDCVRRDLGFFTRRGLPEIIGNIHDNPELLEGKDESISSV